MVWEREQSERFTDEGPPPLLSQLGSTGLSLATDAGSAKPLRGLTDVQQGRVTWLDHQGLRCLKREPQALLHTARLAS